MDKKPGRDTPIVIYEVHCVRVIDDEHMAVLLENSLVSIGKQDPEYLREMSGYFYHAFLAARAEVCWFNMN